jgi:FAD/FMN-containing dehydrogenase
MLKDKTIQAIKKILGNQAVKAEGSKTYALPEQAGQIPELVKLTSQEKFKILPLGNESRIDLSKFSEAETLFLKMSRLSRIKKIVPQDLYAVVEPGLNLKELNSHLLPHNLFYPFSLNNSSESVGGSVAVGLLGNASGKEVHTKELVLALEIVNSSGEILKTGAEVFKSVTGYDTSRLLVGSWGTLGIITSVSLRVFPLNRKKEFEDLKFLSPSFPQRKEGNNSKVNLNRRIKKLLDPDGVFVDLF